jgi:hypothetical protein
MWYFLVILYWIEKSSTKAIGFVVEKIDYMLQRQIVVNALDEQIDIEDLAYIKDTNITFGSIFWIFICVYVTIYRTVLLQQYQSTSHCILLTTELSRRNI